MRPILPGSFQPPSQPLQTPHTAPQGPHAGAAGRSNRPASTHAADGASATASTGRVSGDQDLENRFEAIQGQLTSLFQPHFNGANREDFRALIDDRARTLAEDGETPQSVDAVLTKGSRLDRASHSAVGFIRSVPFGAASIALDMLPVLSGGGKITSPLALSAISGLISNVADTAGNTLMKRATSDTQWLVADEDKLAPVMQDAAAAVKPGLLRQAAEGSMTFQTFTARNLLRTLVQPMATALSDAKTGSLVDSGMAALGSPMSGMTAYNWQHSIDKGKHRVGPEYLLGREDWHQRFKDLKAYGVGDAAAGIAKRVGNLPLDALRDGSKALQSLVTPTGLVSGLGALSGGITAIGVAQSAAVKAATEANFSPAAVAAVGKATVTATMAPVVAAWVTSGVLTQPLGDKVAQALDNLTGKPEHLDEQQGMVPLVDMHPDAHQRDSQYTDDDAQSFASARSTLNNAERMV